jgi:hypothetical protein
MGDTDLREPCPEGGSGGQERATSAARVDNPRPGARPSGLEDEGGLPAVEVRGQELPLQRGRRSPLVTVERPLRARLGGATDERDRDDQHEQEPRSAGGRVSW